MASGTSNVVAWDEGRCRGAREFVVIAARKGVALVSEATYPRLTAYPGFDGVPNDNTKVHGWIAFVDDYGGRQSRPSPREYWRMARSAVTFGRKPAQPAYSPNPIITIVITMS